MLTPPERRAFGLKEAQDYLVLSGTPLILRMTCRKQNLRHRA